VAAYEFRNSVLAIGYLKEWLESTRTTKSWWWRGWWLSVRWYQWNWWGQGINW